MSERNPSQNKPFLTRPLQCEEWETLLADALDGNLPAEDSGSFEAHGKICGACGETLSQAKRGQEWLRFLHTEPEAPPELLGKILALTSGVSAANVAAAPVIAGDPATVMPLPPPMPFWRRMSSPAGMRRMVEPRLMMTAAMAFFSVSLTLNMAGVRLTALRLADLKPSAISTNIDREYHMASARVVRYYDNLRFVYEMEARVRELRRNSETEEPTVQEKRKQTAPEAPQPSPQPGPKKNSGKSESRRTTQPQALLWGRAVEANLSAPAAAFPGSRTTERNAADTCGTIGDDLDHSRAARSERGLA